MMQAAASGAALLLAMVCCCLAGRGISEFREEQRKARHFDRHGPDLGQKRS
jgi:hypothetical protein